MTKAVPGHHPHYTRPGYVVREGAEAKQFGLTTNLASIWRKVTSFLATVGNYLSDQCFLQLVPG